MATMNYGKCERDGDILNGPRTLKSILTDIISREMISKVLGFALVSGVGLGLDFALFVLLVHVGLRPGHANFISASVAVTFVYFVSTKRVFRYQGRFLMQLFLLYLAYQVFGVTVASWAVDVIVVVIGLHPAIAKLLILPLTFSANFLFLHFLTAKKAWTTLSSE
jgi:putative flippase GtrA